MSTTHEPVAMLRVPAETAAHLRRDVRKMSTHAHNNGGISKNRYSTRAGAGTSTPPHMQASCFSCELTICCDEHDSLAAGSILLASMDGRRPTRTNTTRSTANTFQRKYTCALHDQRIDALHLRNATHRTHEPLARFANPPPTVESLRPIAGQHREQTAHSTTLRTGEVNDIKAI
jgi:hypothetical protein